MRGSSGSSRLRLFATRLALSSRSSPLSLGSLIVADNPFPSCQSTALSSLRHCRQHCSMPQQNSNLVARTDLTDRAFMCTYHGVWEQHDCHLSSVDRRVLHLSTVLTNVFSTCLVSTDVFSTCLQCRPTCSSLV